MIPAQPAPLNWTAIGVVVVAIINIVGWFVVHFLTKRREAQRDRRLKDEAAAAERTAYETLTRLSSEEREILRLCSAEDTLMRGYAMVFHVDGHGSWVRVGKKDFADDSDPSVEARYLDALHSLLMRGYIRQESATTFVLTGAGYEKAKKDT